MTGSYESGSRSRTPRGSSPLAARRTGTVFLGWRAAWWSLRTGPDSGPVGRPVRSGVPVSSGPEGWIGWRVGAALTAWRPASVSHAHSEQEWTRPWRMRARATVRPTCQRETTEVLASSSCCSAAHSAVVSSGGAGSAASACPAWRERDGGARNPGSRARPGSGACPVLGLAGVGARPVPGQRSRDRRSRERVASSMHVEPGAFGIHRRRTPGWVWGGIGLPGSRHRAACPHGDSLHTQLWLAP